MGSLTNCVVYFNSGNNSAGSPLTWSYCCTTPLPSGPGNISAPPQLLSDGFHLANSSPCRGTGTDLVGGTDIDGQAWANPPSIGCDEWNPAPTIFSQTSVQVTNNPLGLSIGVLATGQDPLTCYWTKDGVPIQNDGHYLAAQTTTLNFNTLLPTDLGGYQVVLSNAFGMATRLGRPVAVGVSLCRCRRHESRRALFKLGHRRKSSWSPMVSMPPAAR